MHVGYKEHKLYACCAEWVRIQFVWMHAGAMPEVFFHVRCMSGDAWVRKYSMLFGQCRIFFGGSVLSWQKFFMKYVPGLLQQNYRVGSDVAFDHVRSANLIMSKSTLCSSMLIL
jgi:hypothetical protein